MNAPSPHLLPPDLPPGDAPAAAAALDGQGAEGEEEASDTTEDDMFPKTAESCSSVRGAHAVGQAVAAEVCALPAVEVESAIGSDGSAAGSDVESDGGLGTQGVMSDSGVSPDVFSPPNDAKSIYHWKRLGKRGHPLVHARVPTASRVARKPSARRVMWECAALTFHPDALVEKWGPLSNEVKCEQTEALRVLYDFWAPTLFQVHSSRAPSFKDPPPEMLEHIDFSTFKNQYIQLRDHFVPEVLQDAGSAQCWVVERVLVRIGSRDVPVRIDGVAFVEEAPVEKLWGGSDMSLAFGSKSAVGRKVHVSLGVPIAKIQDRSKHCFVGEVVGFEKHMPETALYKLLMTRSYKRDVRPARVWHVLRLYHRLVMAGASTEALAELVGSLLTQRVQAQIGNHRALKHVVGAVMLRCFGVRGDPGDVGFIRRSLNIYFRGKSWHFVLRQSEKVKRARLHPHMLGPSFALHNHRLKVATTRKFSWLSGTLSEVADNCGRHNLRLPGQDHSDLSTPYAGSMLQRSVGAVEMLAKLAQASTAFEPAYLDPRLSGGFGVPRSAGGSGD